MSIALPVRLDHFPKREVEQHFCKLLNCLPVGIFSADAPGVTIRVNKRGKALLHLKKQKLLAQDWLRSIHEDDRNRVRAVWERALKTGQEFQCEYRVASGNCRTQWMTIRAARQCDETGATTGYLGGITDTTEQKLLEKELQQSQKMDSIGRLAGGIAHDFNNLITIILGNAELLMLELANVQESARYELQLIIGAAERAAALTRQLLAYSRKELVAAEPLQINEVVRGLEPMLARVIGENIALITRQQADLWPVMADPGQIEQILMNLVVNARDAMINGGTLSIDAKNITLDKRLVQKSQGLVPGDYLQLTVTDTGCGIPREFLPMVFEPFFTTKPAGVGTGMGLATVFGIVKQSGGHVVAKSRPGRGTRIVIYLPRWDGAIPEKSSTIHPQIAEQNSETILLVEDEDGVRKLAKRILESAGYRVIDAGGTLQAIELAELLGDSIDLLITDVIMPQLCGPQLAESLKSSHPRMKVLYFSGYTADIICPHGIVEEGLSFLRKPFAPDTLLKKVRQVLCGDSEGCAGHMSDADSSGLTPLSHWIDSQPSTSTALAVL